MVFNTYFLHPTLGGCANAAQISHYMPTFKRQINEMAAAIDRRPALIMLEIDALGSSSCIARHGGLPAWEAALRYEVDTFEALPTPSSTSRAATRTPTPWPTRRRP